MKENKKELLSAQFKKLYSIWVDVVLLPRNTSKNYLNHVISKQERMDESKMIAIDTTIHQFYGLIGEYSKTAELISCYEHEILNNPPNYSVFKEAADKTRNRWINEWNELCHLYSMVTIAYM